MLYNKNEFPRIMQTAGKITILTAFAGVIVFVMAFLFDAGSEHLQRVSAQTATTTLTVLNTPPQFTVNAYEITESSTSTPTNSGTAIQWRAVGTDSNSAPYFLLICSTNASPTANVGTGIGTVPPSCGGGTLWGVSAGTVSGQPATVSTTTLETGLFAGGAYSGEKHNWYAWVCDDAAFNPRCNNIPVQGYSATNSSPYHINKRPTLTNFYNNGPRSPGAAITFLSTSTDPDTIGGEDTLKLVVCGSATYNSSTDTCSSNFIASTTIGVTANATTSYTLASILRDTTYAAYGYIVDQHGHEATANPINQNFTVNNVAPVILGADIDLNGGNDLTPTVEGGLTTGFTLDVIVTDANSCTTTVGVAEISSITTSVFRSSLSTSTCNGSAGHYDANDCITSGYNGGISCVASSTSCTGPSDDSRVFNCTFPLWFIADPTENAVNIPAAYELTNWSAGAYATDDDALTSVFATTSSPVELISLTALDLITAAIPYGSLEPGDDTGTLSATTTIFSAGNTGIDQEVEGESMCTTFSVGNECIVSATSTVPENRQKFSSTSLSYGSGLAVTLSSSTPNEVELDINKSISTSSPTYGDTYWGIAVPVTITLAGSYEGLNTFTAVTAEALDW
jgi:hypothetical protein